MKIGLKKLPHLGVAIGICVLKSYGMEQQNTEFQNVPKASTFIDSIENQDKTAHNLENHFNLMMQEREEECDKDRKKLICLCSESSDHFAKEKKLYHNKKSEYLYYNYKILDNAARRIILMQLDYIYWSSSLYKSNLLSLNKSHDEYSESLKINYREMKKYFFEGYYPKIISNEDIKTYMEAQNLLMNKEKNESIQLVDSLNQRIEKAKINFDSQMAQGKIIVEQDLLEAKAIHAQELVERKEREVIEEERKRQKRELKLKQNWGNPFAIKSSQLSSSQIRNYNNVHLVGNSCPQANMY